MKTKKTQVPKQAKRLGRLYVIVATVAVLAVAAITVLSRQSASAGESNERQKVAIAAHDAAGKKYMKVKVAGQDVMVDGQGQIKPLTPDEARKLAAGLKGMLNKSTEGLVQVQNADGSVSMDLQDRFQNVTVARVNQDGTLSTSCVDNPRAAAAFFGIDPKLLEPDKPTLQP
jgi:hypothetical protein